MYFKFMKNYITDEQYFEGFIGAFGTIASFIFFQRTLKLKNTSVIIGLSFLMTWILRKLSMNIYIQLKNDSKSKYKIKILNKEFKGVNIYVFVNILLTSVLAYNVALKNTSYLSIFVYMICIVFFYFFVKQ